MNPILDRGKPCLRYTYLEDTIDTGFIWASLVDSGLVKERDSRVLLKQPLLDWPNLIPKAGFIIHTPKYLGFNFKHGPKVYFPLNIEQNVVRKVTELGQFYVDRCWYGLRTTSIYMAISKNHILLCYVNDTKAL